jgi:hypothetical protein
VLIDRRKRRRVLIDRRLGLVARKSLENPVPKRLERLAEMEVEGMLGGIPSTFEYGLKMCPAQEIEYTTTSFLFLLRKALFWRKLASPT